MAVIGLHENVFKPHTGTKTSVLLVQKWDGDLCPRRDDYPVFFATMRKPGKDNSGEKIYARDSQGNILRDSHFHPVVSHDLYNHEGLTQDGIAEAFIEFAKREGLSFFGDARFSEERYRELVSGLEVSEVMLSEILSAGRMDSGYYSPSAVATEKFVMLKPHYFLKPKEIVSGPFGSTLKSSAYMAEGDIAFVRIENIRGGFHIQRNSLVYISHEDNARLSNSQLYTDDLILSKVGSVGLFARVDGELGTCNISENNIGLKLAAYPKREKHVMLAYLNSQYGQTLIQRRKSGNVQPKLNVADLRYIPIPKFSDDFSERISSLIAASDTALRDSESLYAHAQSILNDAIHFTPRNPDANTSVVSFSQVFSTGRMDAEYFMPKYDELLAHLETLPAKRLGEIVNITKSIEPGSESYSTEGIPFIRVSDITETGITPPAIRIPWAAENEKLYPKKDTILLSKDGTIGIAYKVDSDIEAVTSGALLHLRVTASEVMPDYLALVLNSEAVRLQAERDSNGAIIKHWKPGDIARTVIPIFDSQTQQSISEHVRDSFTLRKESERLIALAVKSVELAVESDEHSAMRLIQEESQ